MTALVPGNLVKIWVVGIIKATELYFVVCVDPVTDVLTMLKGSLLTVPLSEFQKQVERGSLSVERV